MSERRHPGNSAALAVCLGLAVFSHAGRAAGAAAAPSPLPSPVSVASSSAVSPMPSASPYPVPVVAECANPHLPPEILAGTVPAPAAKPLPIIHAKDAARDVDLKLAVAADDNDRDLGLMCVTALRPRHGMIFVFGASRHWEFWMKNTLVPLDMVWLAADGKITSIAAHVPASTRETSDDAVARRGGTGQFVVELADGESKSDGLSVGEKLSLPQLRASQ